ncbi:serine/threonine protein kinase [Bowmanella sp. JS7-9]|uniref:Stress response kinase A n=1 Tax=Pseudobowmanella zhangzhouensis TaxID=1537679 RepID=A0ABW1XIX5_9ALTE|nr:serine/threonine protein kinase [Bowmanella sp. JS7-9]TBX20826.1 serine/threonine protein kinase [Bowmanella sp. JS7-9]
MQDDFSFAGLGPDLILDAIESTPIRVDSGLLALNSYENRVYQFVADDRQRYVVKFYRPARWSDAQIQEEHDFAAELAGHDIPLVAPLLLEGRSLHHYAGYRFAIYPSVGGRQFENDNLEQLEWMGRFIGRIHQVGSAKPFAVRPRIDTHSYLTESQQHIQSSQLVPMHLSTAFYTILEQVCALAASQYQDAKAIRLHGDCHPGNILWRDGPSFVDLDDCRMGPAVQDLWMMLSGERHERLLQLDVLLEAYEEFMPFDAKQLRLIEPLRAMRMVHHMAWLAVRWQDPAFPRAFPWFASDKYWEQQILALKEQLAALHEPALSLHQ